MSCSKPFACLSIINTHVVNRYSQHIKFKSFTNLQSRRTCSELVPEVNSKKIHLVFDPSLLLWQTMNISQTVQPLPSPAPTTPCYIILQTQTRLVPECCSRIFQDSRSHHSRDPNSFSFHNCLLSYETRSGDMSRNFLKQSISIA
jgi:hypothetical protein